MLKNPGKAKWNKATRSWGLPEETLPPRPPPPKGQGQRRLKIKDTVPQPILDVDGMKYEWCGMERGKDLCVYSRHSFTCGSSLCRLGEVYPCFLCGAEKYSSSVPNPEWARKCLEDLHSQYPHGCPQRKMGPSLKIEDKVYWTSSPNIKCTVVARRDTDEGREVKLRMPHWDDQTIWQPEDQCKLASDDDEEEEQ